MREIKFRGKPKLTDKDKLVYGWGCFTDKNERHFIVIDENQFVQVEKIDVFTGIKDMNGEDVYEGDIVSDKALCQFEIKYDEYRTDEAYYGGILNAGFHMGSYGIEVIGNIYENPELLDKLESNN